ncbi:MerR family transcriptional regulator [Jeotgalibacillus sp. R-1-5s-1]|uniref:MerR family transcriptional regulator n=1 Tax=Jeotgalibacillus sp. R-1-5s-1 TaxID=2555897 RepID=UPI00106AD7A0|nr:MerR family transcriptional regulator [Jeotgalibacillus sp. R-1-5s-1]TFE00776.1 MerR family transcriptional regulator [Jeotgalibacillus sp. R-1-5s-1]
MKTTGEVSKLFDLTVRTLRYYDQIGLVKPTSTDQGGRRLYDDKVLIELQKILLLKRMGLPLDQLKTILQEKSIQSILAAHMSMLREENEVMNNKIRHTQSLLHDYELTGTVEWQKLLTLVKQENEDRKWEDYFTPEESEILEHTLPKLENGDPLTKKWIHMVKRINLYIEAGVKPESSLGILLAEEVESLSTETFGDNEALAEKFWEVRKSEERSSQMGLYPISAETTGFLERAFQALDHSFPDNS